MIARFAVQKRFFSNQFQSVSMLDSGPNNMFLKFLPTNPFNLCCTDFFWGVDVKNVFETITGTKSNTHTSST